MTTIDEKLNYLIENGAGGSGISNVSIVNSFYIPNSSTFTTKTFTTLIDYKTIMLLYYGADASESIMASCDNGQLLLDFYANDVIPHNYEHIKIYKDVPAGSIISYGVKSPNYPKLCTVFELN